MKTYKSFELMFEVLTPLKNRIGEMLTCDYFTWEDGIYMIIRKVENDENDKYVDAIRLDERETIPT